MKELVFLRCGEKLTQAMQWHVIHQYDDDREQQLSLQGLLSAGVLSQAEEVEALQAAAKNKKVVVLLPDSLSHWELIEIAAKQKKYIDKILPFMLEEHVAEDVEQLHFAAGKALPSGKVPVIGLSRNIMQQLVQTLEDWQLNVNHITTDAQCLPTDNLAWTVLIEADEALISENGNTYWSCQKDQLADLLTLQIAQTHQQHDDPIEIKQLLRIYAEDIVEQEILDLDAEIEVNQIDDSHTWLYKHFHSSQLNLRQGAFSKSSDWGAILKYWKLPIAASVTAFVLHLGFLIASLIATSQEINNAEDELFAIYQQVIPNAQRSAKNHRANLQNKLNALQGGDSDGVFFQHFANISKIMQQTGDIKPTFINYDAKASRVAIDIEAKDLASVNQYVENLKKETLVAELSSTNSRNNMAIAKIVIKELN